MKWLLRILLLLIVLVVGGSLAAFYLTPSSLIATQAAKAVKEQTGRELAIQGEIERSLYPTLGVKTGPITLSNADWAEEPVMVSAREAVISVKTMSLFGSTVEVQEIRLIDPVVHLEVDESGRKSWEFPDSAREGGSGGGSGGGGRDDAMEEMGEPGGGVALILANIENGLVTYRNRQTGQDLRIEDITLAASLPAVDATFTADGSAVVNGETATLTLALDSPAALQKGERTLADLELQAPGMRLAFDGAVQPPHEGAAPKADGALAFALDEDKTTTAWLRSALPPDLAGLGGVSVDGTFKAEETALDIDMSGLATFKGLETTMTAKATAGAGWMQAQSPADVTVALQNSLMNVGYDGVVQAPEGGQAPVLKGAYRARIPDVQALMTWAEQPAPAEGDPLARLSSVNISGDVDIDASKAVGTLTGGVGYGGRDVALAGQFDGGSDWAQGGAIRADFTAETSGLFKAGWAGVTTVGGAPTAKGDVSFASAKLREFADWAGAGPIAAPAGSFETLDLKTGVDVAEKRFALNGLDLTLDDKKVTGDVTVDQPVSGPPSITAVLQTGALDLRPFTQGGGASGGGSSGGGSASSGGGGSGSSSGGGQRGWSDEPLDLGALRLVNADLDLTTDGLTTNVIRIGKSRLKALLKDGRLNVDIPELALYSGQAVGSAMIDSNGTPELAVDMKMSGVQLRPMLNDASQIDWLEGTGAMSVDIAGAGASMKQIMRSLGGSAAIDFRDGAIVGYNLAALVRNITSLGQSSGEEQKTDFAELAGSFAIKDGVAANNDFRMNGPLVRLTGSGTVDIGAQTLNYRAVPKAVATLKGQGGAGDLRGIAFPLLITGPWEDPSITPDLAGGALESVEGLLADPEGAASFLKDIGGGDAGKVIQDVLGGDGDAGKVIKDVLGGDGDAGKVLKDVLGGGGDGEKSDDPVKALKGLFGN